MPDLNLSAIDLNLLVVFDVVMRTRSTTRAGEQLHLTQSAVSNALRRLRDVIGDPLFQRTARGVVPTAAALQLSGPVAEILVQVRKALNDAKGLRRPEQRRFRLYMSDAAQLIMLPSMLARMGAHMPGLSIETVATSTREARELIMNGDIDLAIGIFDGFDNDFFHDRLFFERYVCMVRKGHPTIKKGRLTLRQFLNSPHIVYRPTAGSHGFFEHTVDKLFSEHQKTRKVALRLGHALGAAEIIRQTDFIASMPGRLARTLARTGGLEVLDPPFESPRFLLSQYWHGRHNSDAAHAWLRSEILASFQEPEAVA